MCEPTTLAIVAMGFQVLGAAQKAQAQRKAADANAAIDEQNAVFADQAAADSVLRGRLVEGRVRFQAGQTAGKQVAAYAAAGVDVQSGSALDVLGDTGMLSELDAQVVRSNAFREAWGYRVQGYQYRQRAQLQRVTGQAEADATMLGGIGNAAQYLPKLSIGGSSAPSAPSVPDYQLAGP